MLTEIFDDRWDLTEGYLQDREGNRWKRRLDSVARLIENASTCAAITIENGSFLIATNKDFIEKSTDQGYLLIDSVLSFLQHVLQGTDTETSFKETFIEICKGAMAGLQLPLHFRNELLATSFIEGVLASGAMTDFGELKKLIDQQIERGHHPSDAGSAFVVCAALLGDFKKTIKFIKDNRKITNQSSTAQFIQAIRSYNKDNIITRDKLADRVSNPRDMHAEMRILALMGGKLKNPVEQYENYIGISKLCCLDCHIMIYAVNNCGYHNQLQIRGAHNVKHTLHWNAPFGITGAPPKLSAPVGGSRSNPVSNPFVSAVVDRYNAERKKLSTGASDVSEYADHSHTSSEDEERIILKLISKLETQSATLTHLKMIPGITIEDKVFQAINKLLEHLGDPRTPATLPASRSLRDYIIHLKEADIAGYLFELNDQNVNACLPNMCSLI
jgi:hypothetical protein